MSGHRLRSQGPVSDEETTPEEGQTSLESIADDNSQFSSASASSRMEENRITALEVELNTVKQGLHSLETKFDDITRMLNIIMNKMGDSEQKFNTIHETSSPVKKTDDSKVSFDEPVVTTSHMMNDEFKVNPADVKSLRLLRNIDSEIFLQDQLNAKCTLDIYDMKNTSHLSRPDSITSDPAEMTFDERLAWLSAAKKFCTKTSLRTDQWVSFLLDEFFTDIVTIDGIKTLIASRVPTKEYSYIRNSWIALILYFFPSEIEILQQQVIKDSALRMKWIKKGENIGKSLRSWIIACKGANGYGPSFGEVKVYLTVLLFKVAPDYIVDFSKITNWTELLTVVDENHFARVKSAEEDIIFFKENLKGATLMSTTTPSW
ncbi:unnamed protein product [Cyberlindnera jadinii]|uniref:Uncharacterized protein n=1 Tax=Cyberlindnera jadinii (strain ATCC 18201 / CBS 1600 / BCRC 20928 / JCM 3617 / NBRC 0987 / NRRL Y-1542) TaxID=983966 RepID=A0A0H5C401_CYBJN|nr:hypothetical protein CYBJADRAFT_49704 [Cyberlindnera jadinii NRRL Y-1542]ODV75558.1 hypothetical protein CYBJADRAFT_49704 [Cyberlindnera jadinii NRRL Y-1542]CEP22678.1 unnamed protein product [Cyberlindnera jadinii]